MNLTTAEQALERIENKTSTLENYTKKELILFAKYFAKIHHEEQLRIGGVVRSGNLPSFNTKFIEARKQFTKACENYLNSKEHKAMIEAFKKVGAID